MEERERIYMRFVHFLLHADDFEAQDLKTVGNIIRLHV
jgi:hypothetical protein